MIKQAALKNVRNFDEYKVTFFPGINILLGENGAGKTSVLEAIYFISFTKSFKAQSDIDMLKQGEDHFQIRTEWEGQKVKHAQGNFLKPNEKRFIMDGETITRFSDVIGIFPLVFQSPEDFRITSGGSGERRRYFDKFISQISKKYLRDLIQYRKLIKNRNAHLKERSILKKYNYTDQLEAYDIQLSPLMFRIVQTRKIYTEHFNRHLQSICDNIFDGRVVAGIRYFPSISANTETDFQIRHLERTQQNIEQEIALRRTLWGPNYDKYVFLRNDTPLIHYASQGEHKIWMTMLKLAEGEIIEEVSGHEPVFLFDDLFAEMDINNSRRIIENILIKKQALITTTDLNDLRRYGVETARGDIHIIEMGKQKN
ncbi:MAG: DNA replication and repair protein RecF [FCB group bacterium]|nr:DNA replication and repair protein RecF [FCB group bacterium]